MTVGSWILVIVLGGLVGWLIQTYAINREYPGGMWGAIIVGIVGGWIGGAFLGTWGWMVAGANIIGAILAAAILSYVIGLFGRERAKAQ